MKTIIKTTMLSVVLFISTTTIIKAQRSVQLAIMLDISGSMQGLINQAQSQLWNIVNTVAKANCDGKVPSIEIALYEYGNDGIGGNKEPYIRQISNFSKDLDMISEQLFKLKTYGSVENCGAVLQDGIDNLQWNQNQDAIKIIFIAGNEIFTQGKVDYKNACANAVRKGIIINTIYCGDCEQGVKEFWKDGADRGKGYYSCINTNAQEVYIESPYDDVILKYNDSLNTTYINYVDKVILEKKKAEGYSESQTISMNYHSKSNQSVQDSNAESFSKGTMVNRTVSKSNSSLYVANDWDLVTNAMNNQVDWNTIEKKSLPIEYQNFSIEELKRIVEIKIRDRKRFEKAIIDLNIKREAYVVEKKKEMNNGQENTLEKALTDGVRKQIKDRGCDFPNT
jgi:hypothetical protein